MPASSAASLNVPLASAAWFPAAARALGWVLVGVGIARIDASLDHAPYRNDFAHYYLAANLQLAGQNPYLTPIEPLCRKRGLEYDSRIPTAANPPLLILAVSTIAWLPLPLAYAAWAGLQIAALGLLLTAIRRLLSLNRHDARWLLMAGVLLNATCLLRQFHYSQVQVIVAALLALALVSQLHRRYATSCALAALAAAFKLYPAALLPWFLLTRLQGRSDLYRRTAAVAVVLAGALLLTGVDAWRSFIVDGLPVIRRSVGGSLTNYSLPALVGTLAPTICGWPLTEAQSMLVTALGKALSAAAIAVAYFVVWRRRLDGVAALGVLTAGMLAASLVCWSHYFVLMILPLAWLWQTSAPAASPLRWPLVALGSLCLWPELDFAVPVTNTLPRLALHYYPLLAIVAAAIALAATPCAPRTSNDAAAR